MSTEIDSPETPGRAIDSDWGFLVVEPWSTTTIPRFFAAAAPAFKEPLIGRKLPSAFARAALVDVSVRITATPDRQGGSLMVMRNMVSYVRTFGTLPDDEVDRLFAELERAVESGTYLFVLPQFLITGTKPSAR